MKLLMSREQITSPPEKSDLKMEKSGKPAGGLSPVNLPTFRERWIAANEK